MAKYHNCKTTCLSKHLHDSRLESDYCNRLLAMKQACEIQDYKIQQEFELPAGIKIIVDFLVWRWQDGKLIQEAHETKGMWTSTSRLKARLFKEKYPYIPYIVIQKRRNKWNR